MITPRDPRALEAQDPQLAPSEPAREQQSTGHMIMQTALWMQTALLLYYSIYSTTLLVQSRVQV